MASSYNDTIKILNQMTSIIDQKASTYKKEMKTMPTARFYSEKKILLDTIDDAIKLAESIKPPQKEITQLILDFKKVAKDISGLKQ
jgi:hypothetical protein